MQAGHGGSFLFGISDFRFQMLSATAVFSIVSFRWRLPISHRRLPKASRDADAEANRVLSLRLCVLRLVLDLDNHQRFAIDKAQS